MILDYEFNPQDNLQSILENSPAPPARRVQGLLMLREADIAALAMSLGMKYNRILRVLRGEIGLPEAETDRRSIAAALGLTVPDLWTEEAEATDRSAA
jgi:hypothetical protein